MSWRRYCCFAGAMGSLREIIQQSESTGTQYFGPFYNHTFSWGLQLSVWIPRKCVNVKWSGISHGSTPGLFSTPELLFFSCLRSYASRDGKKKQPHVPDTNEENPNFQMCRFEPNFEGKTLKIVDLDKNKDLALKKAYPKRSFDPEFYQSIYGNWREVPIAHRLMRSPPLEPVQIIGRDMLEAHQFVTSLSHTCGFLASP